jgi:hypothetical protein
MAKLVIRRSALRQFGSPVFVYLIACGLILFTVDRGNVWLPLLLVAGASAVLLMWRRIAWPDAWTRYLSFGAVLLIICALDHVFYFADFFVSGPQFNQWPFWSSSPQAAVFKAEVMSTGGALLTVYAWYRCGGAHISPALVMTPERRATWTIWFIYGVSLGALVLAHVVPGVARHAGQLLATVLGLGLVCAFVLPLRGFRSDRSRLLGTFAMSVPFIALAAGTGMKANIILAFVPSAVMAWRYARHPVARVGMVMCGMAGLALITAYVNMYRAEVWMPQSNGGIASQTVPQDFMQEVRKAGLFNTVGDGLSAFSKRVDASYFHGWAVSIADEQSYQPAMMFGPLAYVLVPRILWPGKPRILTGTEYSGLVFGAQYTAWSNSSTAAGLYPALYLGYGWPALIAGALLVGAFLAFTTHMALRFGGPLTAGLYIFSMLPFMLRINEAWPAGALAAPIINLVYVLVIVTLARLVVRVAIHRRTAPLPAR